MTGDRDACRVHDVVTENGNEPLSCTSGLLVENEVLTAGLTADEAGKESLHDFVLFKAVQAGVRTSWFSTAPRPPDAALRFRLVSGDSQFVVPVVRPTKQRG